MPRGFCRTLFRIAPVMATCWFALPAAAQPLAAAQVPAAAPATSRAVGEFAPGVLTVIPPDVDRDDAIQLHDIVEIRAQEDLKWEPYSTTASRTLHEMAKNAPFVQDAWCLELAMKPLRMIEVDVPLPNGQVRKQLVWYLVYRVRNTGAGLAGQVRDSGEYVTASQGTEPVRFLPEFVLVSQDRDAAGERIRKAYLDRVVPAAIPAISRRELRGGQLLTSVEMAQQELKIEAGRGQQGVWGVAIWVNVDPQIDFFSVYVSGLSNGYRWIDPPGAYEAGDPPGTGRQITRKTLQLNFWRPGDQFRENEREIRLGVPAGKADLYGVGEGVASQWLYR